MSTTESSHLFRIGLVAAIISITVCAQAADKYTVIRDFNPSSGGAIPYGALVMDASGDLFGANSAGGTNGWGTIFELTPNGHGGWTYTQLYDCGVRQDCAVPMGSLVMDHAGNLFGATIFGNVFEVSPNGAGDWTGSVVRAFNGGFDGNEPSPLALDSTGNLYGTNATGGNNGLGYVFELSHSGGSWSLIHLHDFGGNDGAESTNNAGSIVAGVIVDASGNLYGTTGAGGTSKTCTGGCGVVFKLKNTSGVWKETVLHSFSGGDGSNPNAALLMNSSGNLFGTTTGGGAHGLGVVFEASMAAGGSWRTSVLHQFTGIHLDGAYPNAALIMDSSGNLYGSTFAGGGDLRSCQVMNDNGCGTVFEVSPSGAQWKTSILHAFSGRKDGGFPGGVLLAPDGTLYGAAQSGGSLYEGVIFKLSSAAAAVK
ncbi:MAG TPA: choice-of-anchor tandem repeat GloVer-containing protein [Candidatus Sulfotelmatobacter sp.]|jgi:uncharacterized repeat protein (TIGR03803 family)